MPFILAVIALALGLIGAMMGHLLAEEPSAAPQRAFIIANMAQQLGVAEVRADALQSELVKAQKEVEDWKDTFHAWCGTAPNCGRPDK